MSRRTNRNKFLAITAALLMALTFNACGQNGLETLPSLSDPNQTGASATPAPTATATPSPTTSPTVVPSPSATPKPTVSPTATPAPTASPSPTATATPSPTSTPAPTATPTPTVTPAPSPSDPANPYGRWVLSGYGGRHMTSSNGGSTWTNDVADVANGGDDKWLQRAAIYFKGYFLTFGWRIQSSIDGVTFASTTLGAWIGGVAEGNGRLVAAGSCGGRTYSDDGIKWTEVKDSVMTDCTHLRSVVYGNGIFYAYGDALRMTSPNGVTWTKQSALTVSGIDFGLGYFWGVSGGKTVRSTDGITWTEFTVPGASGVTAFSFVNNFVLLTTTSGKNYRTTDGSTWSQFGGGVSGRVKYGGGVYLSVAWQTVYRSTDGMTWTSKNTGNNSFEGMAWKP